MGHWLIATSLILPLNQFRAKCNRIFFVNITLNRSFILKHPRNRRKAVFKHIFGSKLMASWTRLGKGRWGTRNFVPLSHLHPLNVTTRQKKIGIGREKNRRNDDLKFFCCFVCSSSTCSKILVLKIKINPVVFLQHSMPFSSTRWVWSTMKLCTVHFL